MRSFVPSSKTAFAMSSKNRPLGSAFLDELQKNFEKTFSSVAGGGTKSDSKYYTIGITGSSGLVGTALRNELSKRQTLKGKPVRVVRLSRGKAESKSLEDKPEVTLSWNPKGEAAGSAIDPDALAEMDAIVHLAGENVATGLGPLGFLGIRPWTDEKKFEILDSRVGPTKVLAEAIAASKKPIDFLCASGIGAYGDTFIGEKAPEADETMDVSKTKGFLAQISREWEAATQPAKTDKNRVVNMRFGVVLSTKGGALAKLYPIFLLGGGGNVGSGEQYFSFISARDHARAIVHTLETQSLHGPVNFASPLPCTNAEFTKALGRVLNRPTILPLPSFAVSLLFGQMGQEMLLGGTKAVPSKLIQSGFQFQHASIEQALQSAINEEI